MNIRIYARYPRPLRLVHMHTRYTDDLLRGRGLHLARPTVLHISIIDDDVRENARSDTEIEADATQNVAVVL